MIATSEPHESQMAHSFPSRRTLTLVLVVMVIALSTAAVFVGTETAAASSTWSASSTPDPTNTPPPSPTPSETAERPHEEKLGVQGAERDDLGFLGVVFIAGLGFILSAGAVGTLLIARERRRRDRAEAAVKKEDPSDEQ